MFVKKILFRRLLTGSQKLFLNQPKRTRPFNSSITNSGDFCLASYFYYKRNYTYYGPSFKWFRKVLSFTEKLYSHNLLHPLLQNTDFFLITLYLLDEKEIFIQVIYLEFRFVPYCRERNYACDIVAKLFCSWSSYYCLQSILFWSEMHSSDWQKYTLRNI